MTSCSKKGRGAGSPENDFAKFSMTKGESGVQQNIINADKT